MNTPMSAAETLAKLREPFPSTDVRFRPEVNCRACEKNNCIEHELEYCPFCHQRITTYHTHVQYLNIETIRARLLDVDPECHWESLAKDEHGRPLFDDRGGVWVELSIAVGDDTGDEIVRIGYGEPGPGSDGGGHEAAMSYGLRNAAKAFGVGMEVWSQPRDQRVIVDGTPGVPAGQTSDPRQPLWDLIRSTSAKLGRTENRQIVEHWDTVTAEGAIHEAPVSVLARYLGGIAFEVEAAAS